MGKSPGIGKLTLEIYEGRRRWGGTRLQFRCDAAAWEGGTLLLVSAVGPESAVKALSAALQTDKRIELRAEGEILARDERTGEETVRGVSHWSLDRCTDGYRVFRHKLGLYGLWQILAVAEVEGLLPAATEEALWQHLQTERFTTPLAREWAPWLAGQMREKRQLVDCDGFGCQAAVLGATTAQLDALVEEGIAAGDLQIGGATRPPLSLFEAGAEGLADVADLDAYMLRYGQLLGRQAERALEPLHVPGRDRPDLPPLLRQPFPAQAHVIAAAARALRRQKALKFIGECGVGKTLCGMAAVHTHAAGRPYRALVFCPGTLCPKWRREIEETIPAASVRIIESWKDLLDLDRRQKPTGAEWFVIARDRAKLGSCWQSARMRRTRMNDGRLLCPGCGLPVIDREGGHLDPAKAERKRSRCERVLRLDRVEKRAVDGEGGERKVVNQPIYVPDKGCGEQLWQMNREIWRYAPARYIKRKLKGYFDYLVLDEQHQAKSDSSAQANAAGSLIAACRKVIGLTGTLAGGYAWHLKHILFRMAPRSLVEEGLAWEGEMAFNERYGRIETTIRKSEGRQKPEGEDNKQSHGSSSRTQSKRVVPGIMPSLFGRHLMDKAVFLSLAEVAEGLPELSEEVVPVAMDAETAREYDRVEGKLRDVLKEMVRKGDRRLLGKFLMTLLAYPDHPHGWGEVGYLDGGSFVHVVSPRDLDRGTIRPKEQALLDLCLAEKAAGRQVWVYVQFTGERDVQGRLERLLKKAGLKVGVLRSSVPLEKREAWIAQHGPKLDVCLSHPKLVETGLDLFDKGGSYNMVTLCFYETGYDLFNLRQASRRSWRIGQSLPCRTVYLYYQGTMQERAMDLMGRKLAASQALEGKFSSEGLVALAGDGGSVEMALARSLSERLDGSAVRRAWAKVAAPAVAPPRLGKGGGPAGEEGRR
jgi:hypothetical protein